MGKKKNADARQVGDVVAANEIVVYQPDNATRLEVRLKNDTVWLTQAQMVQLFGRDQSVIARHVRNVFVEGEVPRESNMHFLHIALADRPVCFYSLNVVISVGYRVKSIRGTQFRIWATGVLREYLLHGCAINSRINQLEDKVDRRLAKTEQEISEVREKVDFFVRTAIPPIQGVFFNGQVFDAKAFATRHILSARKSIFLIDSWVDVVTLEMLAKKASGVTVEIVSSPRGNHLAPGDIAAFNTQYGGLSVRTSVNFHDRFLIIDDRKLYLFGASLKDLGRKCFAFTELDPASIVELKARA